MSGFIKFIIRPDKKGKWKRKGAYIVVNVFPTLKSLQHAEKKMGYKESDTTAFWHSNRTGKCIGLLAFSRSCLGGAIVSHEATHAALAFVSWQLTGKTYGQEIIWDDDGECFALAVGNIVREIMSKFYKLKIWKY